MTTLPTAAVDFRAPRGTLETCAHPCVVVEQEADAIEPRIVIRVTVREQRFAIDISASPFVVLIAI